MSSPSRVNSTLWTRILRRTRALRLAAAFLATLTLRPHLTMRGARVSRFQGATGDRSCAQVAVCCGPADRPNPPFFTVPWPCGWRSRFRQGIPLRCAEGKTARGGRLALASRGWASGRINLGDLGEVQACFRRHDLKGLRLADLDSHSPQVLSHGAPGRCRIPGSPAAGPSLPSCAVTPSTHPIARGRKGQDMGELRRVEAEPPAETGVIHF